MAQQSKLKVGVIGASGYTGGELLKVLLAHPSVDLRFVSAGKNAGKKVHEVHQNLDGLTDLCFEAYPQGDAINRINQELDTVFLALPHGKSMNLVPQLSDSLKIIDLGGDYRIKDVAVFEKFYKTSHNDVSHLGDFVYGLTEVNRAKITEARRVANPGCFATAVQLAVYPLIKHDLVDGKIIVDAKTGSSGSGIVAKETTHHPMRAAGFFAYKHYSHQHLAEIKENLKNNCGNWDEDLLLQCHSAPMVRGIFASAYIPIKSEKSAKEVEQVFKEAYKNCFFIRLKDTSPNVNWVRNSNFTDISWAIEGNHVSVFVAIDNLLKGASGQAIQNMNVMCGLPEETGLKLAGGHPI